MAIISSLLVYYRDILASVITIPAELPYSSSFSRGNNNVHSLLQNAALTNWDEVNAL